MLVVRPSLKSFWAYAGSFNLRQPVIPGSVSTCWWSTDSLVTCLPLTVVYSLRRLSQVYRLYGVMTDGGICVVDQFNDRLVTSDGLLTWLCRQYFTIFTDSRFSEASLRPGTLRTCSSSAGSLTTFLSPTVVYSFCEVFPVYSIYGATIYGRIDEANLFSDIGVKPQFLIFTNSRFMALSLRRGTSMTCSSSTDRLSSSLEPQYFIVIVDYP